MFSRNNATVQTITPVIHSAVNMFGRGGKMQWGRLLWVLLPLPLYIYTFQSSSYPCPATKCIWVEQSKKLISLFFFCGLEVCFRILPTLTQTLTFLKKDIMCIPGCHHLPDKIPGTPGKLLVHADYSLLGMCLEHVFELNPFFLFRTLKFSYVKWCN